MNVDQRAGDAGMSTAKLVQRVSVVPEVIEHERPLKRHTIEVERQLARLRQR